MNESTQARDRGRTIQRSLAVCGSLIAAYFFTAVSQYLHADTYYQPLAKLWTTSLTGAEIGAYDSVNGKLYVTNPEDDSLEVIDAASGDLMEPIALSGAPNSVAFCGTACDGSLLAVAVEGSTKQERGSVLVYESSTGELLRTMRVGFLPDMLAFTPDGSKLIVANEGEPNDDYTDDPVGAVTVVDVSDYPRYGASSFGWVTMDFASFNDRRFNMSLAGVRIFGPKATVARDLEPEYIAVSEDSTRAWVAMQEANAIAEVDLVNMEIKAVRSLGTKKHWRERNAIDASNEDGIDGNFQRWPVEGFYMPDAIASYNVQGYDFVITANEGDSRDYDGFSEEARVKDVVLDPMYFPDAEFLQQDENLGRLKISTVQGDVDSDGDFVRLYSYGARSISIWDEYGARVWDSGSEFAAIVLNQFPQQYTDNRADDKGGEPEAVVVGKVQDRTLAFVGLERYSVVLVYDVSNPACPYYVDGVATADDVSPEGLVFIPASKSGDGSYQLAVVNEVSTTVSLYNVDGLMTGLRADLSCATK